MNVPLTIALIALLGGFVSRGDYAITNDFPIDLNSDGSSDFNLRQTVVDRQVLIDFAVPIWINEHIATATVAPLEPAWEIVVDAALPWAVGHRSGQAPASSDVLVWRAAPSVLFESDLSVPLNTPPPPPPPRETGYFSLPEPRWVLVRHLENEDWRYGWIGFQRWPRGENTVEYVGAELSDTLNLVPAVAPRPFVIEALPTGLRITWSPALRNARLQKTEQLPNAGWMAVPVEIPGEAFLPYAAGGFFRLVFGD